MNTELTITTERIDDFPLLLATMQRVGLPEILDRQLKPHGLQLPAILDHSAGEAFYQQHYGRAKF